MGLFSEQNIFFENKPIGLCANIIFFPSKIEIKNSFFVGIKIRKNFRAKNKFKIAW
jgi:hypothetical protein